MKVHDSSLLVNNLDSLHPCVGQHPHQLFLFFRQVFGRLDMDRDEQVTLSGSFHVRQTMPRQSHAGLVFGAGRYGQVQFPPIQRRDRKLGAQEQPRSIEYSA